VVALRRAGAARPLLARGVLLLSLTASAIACTVPLVRPLAELNRTLSTRPNVWAYVVERLPDRWLVGHGPTALADARGTDAVMPVEVTHAHNLLLDQLYATGLVGTLTLLALVTAAAVGAARQADVGILHGTGLLVLLAATAPIEVTASLILNPVAALTLTLLCLTASPRTRGPA
jgi:O-antigen ligase